MAELASFFVRLGTVFDDSGIKGAKKGLNEVADSADKLSGGLGKLAGLVAGGAAIWKLVEFGKDSLNAFAEQERANVALQTAMRNLGVYTEDAFRAQLRFASSLQEGTAFADEQIVAIQATLTTFGLYGDRLREVTRSALDLAVARHLDLNTAAVLLGKAFQGQTETLGRFGLKIQETGNNAADFDAVLKQIQTRFGGAARSELDTFAGKVANMSHLWGEFKEDLGSILVGPAIAFLSWARDATNELRNLIDAWKDWRNTREQEALKDEIERLELLQESLAGSAASLAQHAVQSEKSAKAIQDYSAEIEKLQKRLDELRAKEMGDGKQPKPVFTPPEFDTGKGRSAEEALRDRERLEKASHEKLAEAYLPERLAMIENESLEATILARRLMAEGDFVNARKVLDAQDLINRKKTAKEILDVWGSSLTAISTLSNAKTKEIATLAKAAGFAQTLIHAHQGAGLALATIPPPFGFAVAALVEAAGLAQAASIAGVELASGGLGRRRAGGIPATIGEGSYDEAVLPLGSPQTRALMAAALRDAIGPAAERDRRESRSAAPQQVTLHLDQSNRFEMPAGAGGGAPAIEEMAESLRLATRRGVAELLDLSKEIYETGRARAGES